MTTRFAPACVLMVGMFAAATAHAQQTGRIGLAMGYPTSVGLIWHVTDRVAVRPDVSFSHSSSESTPTAEPFGLTTSTSSSGWTAEFGISALFYLSRWDRARTYLNPAFAYGRSKQTTEFSVPDFGVVIPDFGVAFPDLTLVLPGGRPSRVSDFETTTNTYRWGGAFGAQYDLSDKFSVFGEVGVEVFQASPATGRPLSRNEFDSWGTRGAVGVLFYF